jgi:hypothetical protein
MKTATAAPNPFRRRPANFNLLKFRALEAFEINGAMKPPVWAVHVGFYPARSAYTYLLRLYRFGLLRRRRDDRGLISYSISRRGRERFEWLRANYRQRKEAAH